MVHCCCNYELHWRQLCDFNCPRNKLQKTVGCCMVPLTIIIFISTKNTVKATAITLTLQLQLPRLPSVSLSAENLKTIF